MIAIILGNAFASLLQFVAVAADILSRLGVISDPHRGRP
jgi:hypothetical protein